MTFILYSNSVILHFASFTSQTKFIWRFICLILTCLWCCDFRPLVHRDLFENILIWDTVVVAAAWYCICERNRQESFSEGWKITLWSVFCVCTWSRVRFWPNWKAESSRAKCPDSREVHRPSHAVSRNRIGCWDELLLPEWPTISSLTACWSYLLDCACVF